MSRDKQTEIEKMEIALTESQHEFDKAWKECLHNNAPMPDRENVFYAKYLIDKGYCKASDLAEEIIGEVVLKAKAIFCPDCDYDVADIRYALDWLEAELKKKYIGEDTNVPAKESEKDDG